MATTSFDPDQLRQAAKRLMYAAAELRELTGRLAAIPHGSIAEPVAGRIQALKDKGQQMIKDIEEQTAVTSSELFNVANIYSDLTHSIVAAFTGREAR